MKRKPASNRIRESGARKIFRVFNALFLAAVCIVIIIPIWNVIVTSFAEDKDVMGGVYLLIPKSFTLKNYIRIFNSGYMRGFWNSMFVAVVGTGLAMLADESLLRRGFAVFLLLIGLRQLFPGKPKKKKTGPEA